MLDIIQDGGFGSSGKGKVACVLHEKKGPYHFACINGGSQAGHTAKSASLGRSVMTQHVPVLTAMYGVTGYIGQDSTIDLDVLWREITEFDLYPGQLLISSMASIITDAHKQAESVNMRHISSTMKGNGACRAERIRRAEGHLLMRDIFRSDHPEWEKIEKFIVPDVARSVRKRLERGESGLCETTQGLGLDINHGHYPYVTSTPCHYGNELARWGIPIKYVGDIALVMRTYPIRVGNVDHYTSGPGDALELTWDEVTRRSKSPVPLLEKTTVTQRVRRVFEFSWASFYKAVDMVDPTMFFLAFGDYIDASDAGKARWRDLNPITLKMLNNISSTCAGIQAMHVSTGPATEDTAIIGDIEEFDLEMYGMKRDLICVPTFPRTEW